MAAGRPFRQPLLLTLLPEQPQVVVVGAGPAGLTAAYQLTKLGVPTLVLEQGAQVGGIARTEVYKGYRFDLGGHRFFTKVGAVESIWHEVLGDDFWLRPRLSRIYYDGQFYQYPLDLFDTLAKLGVRESALAGLSYLRWQLWPHRQEETFEQWVVNRFGRRLYETFFKAYTEKVWGVPCSTIGAEWAAQRIRGLSLRSLAKTAVFGNANNQVKSLIDQFHYPRLGPGMMWEAMQARVEKAGGEVALGSEVVGVEHEGGEITAVLLADGRRIATPHLISTMPITHLVQRLRPAAPTAVLQAAQRLRYRHFLLVGLIVDHPDLFPDNWLYIHSPSLRVGRIQNFKNWSPQLVPDAQMSSLGMEYFYGDDDDLARMDDAALTALATAEWRALGLMKTAVVVTDSIVLRQPKAYPLYDQTYRQNLDILRRYLAQFGNLQTIGRNGMHRYNNQDHAMLTALLAVRNWQGEAHDLWSVNTERSYYETFTVV